MKQNGTGHVLNLDELFGVSKVIKVHFNGADHVCRHPDSMGPADWVVFEQILGRINGFQVKDQLTVEESQTLDAAVKDGLLIICPGLIEAHPDLPFLARMRVLEYYSEQITPEDTKKALTPSTGV